MKSLPSAVSSLEQSGAQPGAKAGAVERVWSTVGAADKNEARRTDEKQLNDKSHQHYSKDCGRELRDSGQ
jgi:hypothetical protein